MVLKGFRYRHSERYLLRLSGWESPCKSQREIGVFAKTITSQASPIVTSVGRDKTIRQKIEEVIAQKVEKTFWRMRAYCGQRERRRGCARVVDHIQAQNLFSLSSCDCNLGSIFILQRRQMFNASKIECRHLKPSASKTVIFDTRNREAPKQVVWVYSSSITINK